MDGVLDALDGHGDLRTCPPGATRSAGEDVPSRPCCEGHAGAEHRQETEAHRRCATRKLFCALTHASAAARERNHGAGGNRVRPGDTAR